MTEAVVQDLCFFLNSQSNQQLGKHCQCAGLIAQIIPPPFFFILWHSVVLFVCFVIYKVNQIIPLHCTFSKCKKQLFLFCRQISVGLLVHTKHPNNPPLLHLNNQSHEIFKLQLRAHFSDCQKMPNCPFTGYNRERMDKSHIN